jgi:hypothetical protein
MACLTILPQWLSKGSMANNPMLPRKLLEMHSMPLPGLMTQDYVCLPGPPRCSPHTKGKFGNCCSAQAHKF